MMIQVTINGEVRQLPTPMTFEQLVADMALPGTRFAVERNGEIVPKSRYRETRLVNGDKLEIVVAVGGG